MQVIHARCAGLDVHPDSVVATVLLTSNGGQVEKCQQSFGTFVHELLQLRDWLQSQGVTHAAMESTGAYWKPVWNLLEDSLTLLLVNAQHLKRVPGRKTDISDSEWLADLLRHGLLRASFVPLRPQRELVRHRSGYVDRTAQVKNELQEALESANIKLARVASDITGVSAMEMLAGLLAGRATAEELAELARGRMRSKKGQLAAALQGCLQPHHRLIVSQLLADLAWCEEQIAEVTAEITRRLAKEEENLQRLDEIPGINRRIAEVIIAEAGSDMTRFPTVGHFVAWSGFCPGNHQSGGRRRQAQARAGNRSLKRAIAEAAHAAGRKKGSFFQARYQRLARRRGKKRAKVAVGHSLLKTVYHMLSRGTHYAELGQDYYERRDPVQAARKLARRIEKLGFSVELKPLPLAA